MKVEQASQAELQWLCDRADCTLTEDARGLKAMDAGGTIRGMVVFDGWTENACYAHMASDTPIAWRSLAPTAFDYVFRHAGRGLVVGAIPADNAQSLALARHLGLAEKWRAIDGWARGVDMVFMVLRKEHCRWLHVEHREAA